MSVAQAKQHMKVSSAGYEDPHDTSRSGLQLPLHASRTEHGRATVLFQGKDLTVVKAGLAGGAAETLVVPFAAEGLDVLSNDGRLAALALWSAAFGALRLAAQTPGVAVLFNVRHALLKGIAALGAEKVAVVPVLAERDGVLANDGRRAVLAARCEILVPVEMAVEAKAFVAIVRQRLSLAFFNLLPGRPPANAIESCHSFRFGLGANLQCLETGATGEADEALGMESLGHTRESNDSALDGQLALVTTCRRSERAHG